MSISPPAGRVHRLRHELKQRPVHVVRIATLSPHIRSITFGGDALADFTTASFDDHIKLIFDEGDGTMLRRDYTPRRYDAETKELTLEFALHDDGPAANWAARARPGQAAIIAGPRSSFIVPSDFPRHVLVGDETALPAIARRLEELPADVAASVIVHVGDVRDRRALPSAAQLDLQWVSSNGAMLKALRTLKLTPGETYAWGAGEAGVIASLQQILVGEKGMPRDSVRLSAYWKRARRTRGRDWFAQLWHGLRLSARTLMGPACA